MSKKAKKSLARKLAAYSLAGGAVALAGATTAQGSLTVYDHRSDPIFAKVSYWDLPHDMALFRTDGSYEFVEYADDGTTLVNGEEIVPADKTDDSVWFTYETYYSPVAWGQGDQKDGINLHSNVGNGVAGTGWINSWGHPVYDSTQFLEGDVVDGSSNFFTDGSGVNIYGYGSGGSGTNYGWLHGYVGFSLEEEDGTHYGWVKIDVGGRNHAWFAGWAYETEPNVGAQCYFDPHNPGDCDLDGDVDWADYQALESAFGTETGATWADGDFDGDGDVDWADYQTQEAHFGEGTTGVGNLGNGEPVPEPMTLSLLALGAAGLLASRRKRA